MAVKTDRERVALYIKHAEERLAEIKMRYSILDDEKMKRLWDELSDANYHLSKAVTI